MRAANYDHVHVTCLTEKVATSDKKLICLKLQFKTLVKDLSFKLKS